MNSRLNIFFTNHPRYNSVISPLTRAFMIIVFLTCAVPAKSQSLIEVMLEQIAKLQVLITEVEKGYSIAQHGLTIINDIKHGDFDLHSLFFSSLSKVKPDVKNYVKVADIITMQIQMLIDYKKIYQQFQFSGVFDADQLRYLLSVYTNLMSLASEDISDLTEVISDNKYQMKDNERLAEIDKIYKSMIDKYTFLYSFSNETQIYVSQKQKSLLDIQNIKKLFQP